MRVLIHVGSPKTGTSSLQQYLHAHREQLEQVAVLYPDFGHRAHWLLSIAFGPEGGDDLTTKLLARRKDKSALADLRDRCRAMLAGFDGELLIFSNEGLSVEPRAANLVKFVEKTRPDAEVIVLDYIRDPVSHFPSATQQNLKAAGDRTLFPADWRSTHCVRGLNLLETMPERLALRVFSPRTLIKGDVIEDFIAFVRERTGIALPGNTDAAPRNVSHSAAACAVLALRDLAPHVPLDQEDRRKLGKPLRATDAALRPAKLKLPDRFRQAIEANNHEDWNRLMDAADCDETTRAALKLPVTELPEGIERENSALWVIESLDETFVRALLDNFEAMLNPRAAARLAAWLTAAVNDTAHLHGVTIGDRRAGLG